VLLSKGVEEKEVLFYAIPQLEKYVAFMLQRLVAAALQAPENPYMPTLDTLMSRLAVADAEDVVKDSPPMN
jgi:hypothetical protein